MTISNDKIAYYRIETGKGAEHIYEPGYIHFRVKRQSNTYVKIHPEHIITEIPKLKHCYEIIVSTFTRRLVMDLDKIEISYDDTVKFCDSFIAFIRIRYQYEGVIDYRIHASIENKDDLPDTFSSLHIVFNLATHTSEQSRQLITEFMSQKCKFSECIDTSVYGRNKLLRPVLHNKEAFNTTPMSKKYLYPVGYVNMQTVSNGKIDAIRVLKSLPIQNEDFITNTTDSTPIINVVIRVDIQKKTVSDNLHNISYSFDQKIKLKKHLKTLTLENLTNVNIWNKNLMCVQSVLRLSGVKNEDILSNPIMIDFLKMSRVGKYDNIESEESNRKIVSSVINDRNFHIVNPIDGFFHILQNPEVAFIYNKLNYPPETYLVFKVCKYNNQFFIHIGERVLYDINNKIILIDFVCKEVITNVMGKPKKSHKFKAREQYQYFMENIKSQKVVDITLPFPIVNINHYSEIPTNMYESSYAWGPVGSRKSSLRLNEDVKDILTIDSNKLLFICDTRSMTLKTYSDIMKLFVGEGYDTNSIYHYLDSKKNGVDITDNIKVLVVCYDSIKNFPSFIPTHIMLDECNNITKRFLNVMKNETAEKIDLVKYLFSLINSSMSVKMYDADADEGVLTLFKHYITKPITIYRLVGYTQYNNTISIQEGKSAIEEIIGYILSGKKISISCGWKGETQKMNDYIMSRTQKRACIITDKFAYDNNESNKSQDLKKILLTDTTLWADYDLMIYTPAIQTGISFDGEDVFYKHYGFIGCGADYTQQTQMLYRIRKLESREIVICALNNQWTTLRNDISIIDDTNRDNYNFLQFQSGNMSLNIEPNNYIMNRDTGIVPLDATRSSEFTDGYNIGYNRRDMEIDSDKYLYKCLKQLKDYNDDVDNKMQLYKLISKCYEWGSHNLLCKIYPKTSEIIPTCVSVEENIDIQTLETVERIDWDTATFLEKTVFDNDNSLDPFSREGLDETKTKTLLYYGYSRSLYETNSESIDKWVFDSGNFTNTKSCFNSSRNITLYKYRGPIYSIYDNCLKNNTDDYIATLYKSKTKEAPINFINKLFGFYVSFKLFDIIGLSQNEIFDIYRGVNVNVSKAIYYDKIKDFLYDLTVMNAFNAILAFKANRMTGVKDIYKQIGNILCFALKSIGLSVKMNKQGKQDEKVNRVMNITICGNDRSPAIPIKYRVQKSYNRLSNGNENDYDDITNNEVDKSYAPIRQDIGVIYPKLKMSYYDEYEILYNWIKNYIGDEKKMIKYTIEKSIEYITHSTRDERSSAILDSEIIPPIEEYGEDEYITDDVDDEYIQLE